MPAIKGEKILCLGITEPDAGSDVAGIKTRAVRDGDEYVINGSKTYITNGHRADVIVLVTKTDPDAGYDGFTLFLGRRWTRPASSARRSSRSSACTPPTRRCSPSRTSACPDTACSARSARASTTSCGSSRASGCIGAAGCVAGAQRCFDRTLQYAKERTAFGKPIGNFQVIRHKFAEMATKIESARQLVYTTAWRFQNGEYPVREISMAKLYASRIAVEVADECIQIHGGAGYMKEYGVERVWRDMRLNRIGAGTDEIMLDVIGRSYGI